MMCLMPVRPSGEGVGERTLWYAAWSGNLRLTRELLAEGADPNSAVNGKTPLMEAVDEPGQFFDDTREAVVEALLGRGADVGARDGSGWTALHFAGRADVRAVELLLAAGADPRAEADDGTTVLHRAAEHNNVDAARAVIAAGADPTVPDHRGLTALEVAHREYDPVEIRALLFVLEGG
jgi:ankyrin repeat protein